MFFIKYSKIETQRRGQYPLFCKGAMFSLLMHYHRCILSPEVIQRKCWHTGIWLPIISYPSNKPGSMLKIDCSFLAETKKTKGGNLHYPWVLKMLDIMYSTHKQHKQLIFCSSGQTTSDLYYYYYYYSELFNFCCCFRRHIQTCQHIRFMLSCD